MSLLKYKKFFDESYQEVFQKTLVAKEIMNTRFQPTLKYGASIERAIMDFSGVLVRTASRNNQASTIDTIADSSEFLTVNLEKEAVFYIADGDVTQTGPLNPGTTIGMQVARKVALDLDGRCFAEIRNALFSFDNGDLTTGTSSGVAITLSSTTVPQMAARMPAKLRAKNNQEIMTNMVYVTDSYAASDVVQYLLGKNIDLAGNVFANGYSGDVQNAALYVSEQLPADATLLSTGVFADGDTVTVNGTVFTMKTALGAVAGQVLIGVAATNSIQNIVALMNAPTVTTAQGIAFTASADLATLAQLTGTATSATLLTVTGIGTGRLTVSKSAANWTWSTNTLHTYFGKKGAIDLVVQNLAEVDMRVTPDRRGTNVFTSYLAGLKTFADGARKFLNVWILVP